MKKALVTTLAYLLSSYTDSKSRGLMRRFFLYLKLKKKYKNKANLIKLYTKIQENNK